MERALRRLHGSASRRAVAFVAALAALAAIRPATGQLVLAGNHRIFQNEVGGSEEPGDRFGAALAAGDFNRDGYVDLAIGAPGEAVGATAGAGTAYVVYGSADGLGESQTAPLVLHQDVASVQEVAETDDRFGAALATADVNGDGWDDVVVGVPGEVVSVFPGAGGVQVFLSSVAGVVAAADSYFDALSFSAPLIYSPHGSAEFGSALAVCDLDGDGREDLLVGAPDRPDGDLFFPDMGHVLMLPGSAGGLTTEGAETWTSGGLQEDRFGAALACARSGAAGPARVLVGATRHVETAAAGSGAVFTLLDGVVDEFDTIEHGGAHYGTAVAWGDFAGLGEPQAIAAAPGWSFPGPIGEAGVVFVREIGSVTATSFSQDSAGVDDDSEGFDHFGAALAVADFDRDGYDDAVISAPDENLLDGPGVKLDVGVVHVLFGGSDGLSGSGDQYWHLDSIGFGALANDRFGAALAVGDFDGNGVDDLAIGAPGAEWLGQAETGIVQILYGWPAGWIFGDDFEGGNAEKWSP